MDNRDVFNLQVLEQTNTSEFKSPPEQMPTMLHNVCVRVCATCVCVCAHVNVHEEGNLICNIPLF